MFESECVVLLQEQNTGSELRTGGVGIDRTGRRVVRTSGLLARSIV